MLPQHITVVIIAVIIVDGNMIISENDYFEYLFIQLENHSLLPMAEKAESVIFQHCVDILKFPKGIIQRIKKEVGLGFENVFQINSRKALLIRNNYSNNSSLVNERTGVYFAVLGCVLDYMLDDGNYKERKRAIECLTQNFCSYYFEGFGIKKSDSVIDELFEYIGIGLQKINEQNHIVYIEIVEMIYSVIESELFVSGEKSQSTSAMDKSILFEIIILKMMTADLYIESDELFRHIGCAIQIIDDVCDVFEDLNLKNMNPILIRLTSENYKEVIDNSLVDLSSHIKAIELTGSSALTHFVRHEISEWCMSCKYIREKVWKNG